MATTTPEDDRPTIPAPACPRERDAAELSLQYALCDLTAGRREALPSWPGQLLQGVGL